MGRFYRWLHGPIFTLAGLVIISGTFYLQTQEFKHMILEQRLAREEFSLQNQNLSLQRFENTFFQLLSAHSKIIDMTTLYSGLNKNDWPGDRGKPYVGRDCFKFVMDEIARNSNPVDAEQDLNVKSSMIDSAYQVAYMKSQTVLSHYFNNMFHLLKYVDSSTFINEDQKRFYVDSLKTQLSPYELICTFHEILYNKQNDETKAMAHKYDFLEILNYELMAARNVNPHISHTEYRTLWDQDA